ncbi:MAG: FAD-binding protein [Proteobacteria bacterium]|nr:FAD-binding protein [Pseudomonadota bacterium]
MTKVLVIAEHHQEHLAQSTKNTMDAALKIAPECDVLLASNTDKLSEEIAALVGVGTVLVATHPAFLHIFAEDLASLIVSLAKDYTHILFPATTFGKNVSPRVAAMLEVAQISDVCAVESDTIFTRPIYAGNAFEKVQSSDPIKVLTVRTTAFNVVANKTQKASIQKLTTDFAFSNQVEFISAQTPELTRPELTSAKVIISGGRGLKSADNFKMLEKIADKLGAAIGASRAAVDAGFVPNDFQVGQTGKVVAPNLYIAVGISGAIQHIAGMKDSKVIVAINKDPDAPIFQVADYGLVGDLFTLLPELEAALSRNS